MLEKQDLQAISELIDIKLQSIKEDITIIKTDIKEIKQDVHFNRKTDNDILNYIDDRIELKMSILENKLKNQSA